MRLWYLVVFLLLLPTAIAVECTFSNTPILDLTPSNGTVIAGSLLSGTAAIGNNINSTLKVSPVDDHPIIFVNSRWSINTTTSLDKLRFLFYAVSEEGCTDTRLLDIKILHPPDISAQSPPAGEFFMVEGGIQTFKVNKSVEGIWLLDGVQVSQNSQSYIYRPGYQDAGIHILKYSVADIQGLTTNVTWRIRVNNTNRPPLLIAKIIGLVIPLDGDASSNLTNYFIDPDGTKLSFSAIKTYPVPYADTAAGDVDIIIENNIAEIIGREPGNLFIEFTATDLHGASTTSEPIPFLVLNVTVDVRRSYCGDQACVAPENCENCLIDCGTCTDDCIPKWDCTDWGECEISGYQYRNCIIVNECENMTVPNEARLCEYEPTCTDGLQNGNETGVDCGGSCATCPTCFDNIQNQGEDDVDCGGPCNSCPSCFDGVKNQDESDVDCGGSCDGCNELEKCNTHFDCNSKSCIDGLCIAPTCSDGVRNQAEEYADCGGPCNACPTCSDSIQNQGETGVDCGGPCATCPTCFDEIRNQEESRPDCGGPCRACTFQDYRDTVIKYGLWSGVIFLSIMILYLIRVIVTSRLIFLIQNNKFIYFFYEDEPTYFLVFMFNRFFRYLRFNRHKELHQLVESTYAELYALRTLPEKELRQQMIQKLRELYSKLVGLSPAFEYESFVPTIRRIDLPFMVKIIILKNSRLLYLIEKTRLYGDAGFALEDVLRRMQDLRKAF